MQWYSPWAFLLLILIPLTWWLAARPGHKIAMLFSATRPLERIHKSGRIRLGWLPLAARIICIALLITALARPRQGSKFQRITTHGVLLNIVVDRSGSMAEIMDYRGEQHNRLETVKMVVKNFVLGNDQAGLKGRPNDLIGLITFARYADTACPLVLSHETLIGFLEDTELVEQRSEDGTAIGEAIALGGARLTSAAEEINQRNKVLLNSQQQSEFQIESKAVILLTDGQSNAGDIDPLEAVELAKEWGIKVYTIGIGGSAARNQGLFARMRQNQLNEPLLRKIAEDTGGFYARADDGDALNQIFEQIDKQEKSEIQSVEYSNYDEKFSRYALAALLVLALEIFMRCTVFRKTP